MAFLRDFLVAKDGVAKEVGVLPCPANNVVLNYRVTKIDKEGPFQLTQGNPSLSLLIGEKNE